MKFKEINLLMLTLCNVLFFSAATFAAGQLNGERADSTKPSMNDLGKGTICIRLSAFAPGQPVPEVLPVMDDPNKYLEYVYYVKHPLVLRNDLLHRSPDTITVIQDNNSLTVTMLHPVYWINWEQQNMYVLSGKKDFLARLPLKEHNFEPFYSTLGTKDSTKAVDTLNDTTVLTIAGKRCYKGIIRYPGGESLFYYTRERLSVISPLNAYLPRNFPYAVMSLTSVTNWTNLNKTSSQGHVVVQVVDINTGEPDERLMTIPASLPIKDNVSLQDIFLN